MSNNDEKQLRHEVFRLIMAERVRQIAKWGKQDMPYHDWVLVLSEEMGELAKEFLENNNPDNLLTEAVQVAAVVTQIFEWAYNKQFNSGIDAQASIGIFAKEYKFRIMPPAMAYMELLIEIGVSVDTYHKRTHYGQHISKMGLLACQLLFNVLRP